MLPTEILKQEHRIIETVLDAAETELNEIRNGKDVNTGRIDVMVDFFRNFADGCHHAKEEKILFVKLLEKGMSLKSGPIAVMLSDHEYGRARIKGIAEANKQIKNGNKDAAKELLLNLAGYINMLRSHIQREDHILFAMADKILSPDEQAALAKAFEKNEKEDTGFAVHEKYQLIAKELINQAV